MSDVIQSFPRASFAGIQFPWNKISIKGSLRHHVHEYPHQPGGDIEELGRKLYEFKFSSDFHDTLRDWPNAYPGNLAALRGVFDTGKTFLLVIPNFGEIQAKCIDWGQNLTAKIRSGESTEWTFLENTQNKFSVEKIVGTSSASMEAAHGRLRLSMFKQGGLTVKANTLLDDLLYAIATLRNLVGYGQMLYGAAKSYANTISDICARIDALPFFEDCRSAPSADALGDITANANQLSVDALRANQPLQYYYTPKLMGIIEVSMAIFGGDPLHAIELMQLNSLDDALLIPAGTMIAHYGLAETARLV
jgi:hypothetical protein